MRILGSIPLTNGYGCGFCSVSKSSVTLGCKKSIFKYFFMFYKIKFLNFKTVKICLIVKNKRKKMSIFYFATIAIATFLSTLL
jgi:hypothetical protein